MKIRHSLLALMVVNLTALEAAMAIPVDLTLGTTGTTTINQSFNETRGVTATPAVNLQLLSMTLGRFDLGISPDGTVGARVYDDATQALIASQDQTVPAGSDQSVTIPIVVTLIAGEAYRFAFFVSSGSNGGAGDLFDPDPPTLFAFSYLSGPFQLTGAWATPSDAFPNTQNTSLPFMTLEVVSIPEPATLALLSVAIAGLGLSRRCNPH